MNRTTLSGYGVVTLALAIASVPLAAQLTLSTIRGTAADPSGAVVAGAEITVLNLQTNERRTVKTNENGDFEKRGYFSEIPLRRANPKLFLVAPVFSFHDSTEQILRCVDPRVEVWKRAVNEDWRCGITVLSRKRL